MKTMTNIQRTSAVTRPWLFALALLGGIALSATTARAQCNYIPAADYRGFAVANGFATETFTTNITVTAVGTNVIVTTNVTVEFKYEDGFDPGSDKDGDSLSNLQEFNGWASSINGAAVFYGWDTDTRTQNGSCLEDVDSDCDGMSDAVERRAGTNPRSGDTDGDGMGDPWEVYVGLDPTDNGTVNADNAFDADPDGDGLNNLEEMRGPNCVYSSLPCATAADDFTQPAFGEDDFTYPLHFDSDGDQLIDSFEYGFQLNPSVADDANADTDSDGLTTFREQCIHPLLASFWSANSIPASAQFAVSITFNTPGYTGARRNGLVVQGYMNEAQFNDVGDSEAVPGTVIWDHPIASSQNSCFSGTQRWTRPTSSDSDGDLLPDGWEVEHGLNPLNGQGAPAAPYQENNTLAISGPFGDPDLDNLLNYQEYLGADGRRIDLITGTGDETDPWITRALNNPTINEFETAQGKPNTGSRANQSPVGFTAPLDTTYAGSALPGFFDPALLPTLAPIPGVPPSVALNDGSINNFNPQGVAISGIVFLDNNANGVFDAADDCWMDADGDNIYTPLTDFPVNDVTPLAGGETGISIVANKPVNYPMPGLDTDDDGLTDEFEVQLAVDAGLQPSSPVQSFDPFVPRSAAIQAATGITPPLANRRFFAQDATAEAWVYLQQPNPAVIPDYRGVFVQGRVPVGAATRSAFEIGVTNRGTTLSPVFSVPIAAVETIAGKRYQVASARTIPFNQWVHIAVVFDNTANSLSLYVNGILEQSLQVTEDSASSWGVVNGGSILVGANRGTPANSFAGNLWIDEVRVWGVARTADQVNDNRYNYINPAQTVPTNILASAGLNALVAYFTFDDGGDSAEDLTRRAKSSLLGYNFPADSNVLNRLNQEYWYGDQVYAIPSYNTAAPATEFFRFDSGRAAPVIGVLDGERGAFDSDGDQLPDGWEVVHGFNAFRTNSPSLGPLQVLNPALRTNLGAVADAEYDGDADGLSARYEYWARTNPRKTDSDADGIFDTLEDFDGDGIPNRLELTLQARPDLQDTDEDGLSESVEQVNQSLVYSSLSPSYTRVLRLDGSRNSYIEIPERSALRLDKWTIEARFMPALTNTLANGQGAYLIRRVVQDATNKLQASTFELRVVKLTGGGVTNGLFGEARYTYVNQTGQGFTNMIRSRITNDFVLVAGATNHLAATYDPAAGQFTLYYNGRVSALTNSALTRPPLNGTGPMVFTRIGEGFAGDIDEVRIWSGLRTADQIRDFATTVISSATSNLVSVFTFDDGGIPGTTNAAYTFDNVITSVRYAAPPAAALQTEGATWRNGANLVTYESGRAYTSPAPARVFSEGVMTIGAGLEQTGDFAMWVSRNEMYRFNGASWIRWGASRHELAPVRSRVVKVLADYIDLLAEPDVQVGYRYLVEDDGAGNGKLATFRGPDSTQLTHWFLEPVYAGDRFLVADTQLVQWSIPSTLITAATTADLYVQVLNEGTAYKSDGTAWVRWGALPSAEDFTTLRNWDNQWNRAAKLRGAGQIVVAGAGSADTLDTDGDGIPDYWEIAYGLNPNDATGENGALGDPDGDGLTNYSEFLAGKRPRVSDTDGDGVPDGQSDSDGDGLSDIYEQNISFTALDKPDTDDDGLTDKQEVDSAHDPRDSISPFVMRYIKSTSRSGRVEVPGRLAGIDEYGLRHNLTNWTLEAMVWLDEIPVTNSPAIFIRRATEPSGYINYELGARAITSSVNGDSVTNAFVYARFQSDLGSNYEVVSYAPIPTGRWYHVGAKFGRDERKNHTQLGLFFDNIRIMRDVTDIVPATGVQRGSLVLASNMLGRMDEVRIWNVNRTDSEVEDLKARTLLFGADVAKLQSLNVAGGTLNRPLSDDIRLGTNWTVEAWFRTTESGTILKRNTGIIVDNEPLVNFMLSVTPAGLVEAAYDFRNRWLCLLPDQVPAYGRVIHTGSSKLVNDGEWHHVSFVLNGSASELYLDGAFVDSVPFPPSYDNVDEWFLDGGDQDVLDRFCYSFNGILTEAGPLVLGTGYEGNIDEARIFDIPSTAIQVKERYIRKSATTEDGLVSYFDFDDLDLAESGGQVTDKANVLGGATIVGNASLDSSTGANAPIKVNPLLVLAPKLSGYFPFDDGRYLGGNGVQSVEDFLFRASSRRAGSLLPSTSAIDFVTPTNGFAGYDQAMAYPSPFPLPSDSPFRLDADDDGMPDLFEQYYDFDPNRSVSPENPDIQWSGDLDKDGLNNLYEYYAGTDPTFMDSNANGLFDADEDPDRDGLPNRDEQRLGTHPLRVDSDDDGLSDFAETRPTNASNPAYSDDPRDPVNPVNTNLVTRYKSARLNGVELELPRPLLDQKRFNATNWTVELWLNTATASTTGSLVRYTGNMYSNYTAKALNFFTLGLSNGFPYTSFEATDGTTGLAVSQGRIPTNRWTHLAAVWDDENNALSLYMDGVMASQLQVFESALSGSFTADLFPGRAYLGSAGFTGNVDEVRIWKHARTQAEVIEGTRSLVSSGADGLELYLRFDDGRRTTNGLPSGEIADGNSFADGQGAEDYAHRVRPDDLETPWLYSLRGVTFDYTNAALATRHDFTDEDIDEVPDWYEATWFNESFTYPRYTRGSLNPVSLITERLRADKEASFSSRYLGWNIDYTPITSVPGYRWSMSPDAGWMFKDVYLDEMPAYAEMRFAVANNQDSLVYVNGQLLALSNLVVQADSAPFNPPDEVVFVVYYAPDSAFRSLLKPGRNRIAVQMVNRNGNGDDRAPLYEYFNLVMTVNGSEHMIKEGDRWWAYYNLGSMAPPPADAQGRSWFATEYAIDYDGDPDRDGLMNWLEARTRTNPRAVDTDGDGQLDSQEDLDQDGLINADEQVLETDPRIPDTDDDGYSDGYEHANGSDPADSLSPANAGFAIFNGAPGTFVELPVSPRFALREFIVETLVAPSNTVVTNGTEAIIIRRSMGNSTTTNDNFVLGLSSSRVPFVRFQSFTGLVQVAGPQSIPTGTFSHVAASYDQTRRELALWVNSNRVTYVQNINPPVFNHRAWPVQRIGENFIGALDDVKISSGTNVIAHYRFDDGTATSPLILRGEVEDFTVSRGWDTLWLDSATIMGSVTFKSATQDSDGDGIPDDWELLHGLNPNDASDAAGDLDGDGLNNLAEYWTGNDPRLVDTNGDGILDGESDFDLDSLSNIFEVNNGLDPRLPDTDDDGLSDGEEWSGRDNVGSAATVAVPAGATDPLNSLEPMVPRSMQLNGASRLIINDSTSKYASASFTIQAWVNPTNAPAAGQDQVIMRRYVEGSGVGQAGANYELGIRGTADPLNVVPYLSYSWSSNGVLKTFTLAATNFTQPGCVNGIPVNDWTHLAAVMNATSALAQIYVNGALASYVLAPPQHPVTGFIPASSGEVTIGAERSTGAVTKGFRGFIDEVKFSAAPIPQGEIASTYDGPVQNAPRLYDLPFKSGSVSPDPGISPELSALPSNSLTYAVVQFEGTNETANLANLNAKGLAPLYRVSKVAYAVRGTAAQISTVSGARWRGLVPQASKISTRFSNPVTTTTNILVEFYPGASETSAKATITAAGVSLVRSEYLGGRFLVVRANEVGLANLSKQDSVAYLRPAASYLLSGNKFKLNLCNNPAHLHVAPFAVDGEGWDGPGRGAADLTYYFANATPDLSAASQRAAMTDALAKWSNAVDIDFASSTTANQNKQLDLSFQTVDGTNGILAFAYLPAPDPNPETIAGDVTFDEAETWSVTPDSTGLTIDLRFVALHEFGHSLGMLHSDDPAAIMYPFYQVGLVDIQLQPDDIEGIRSLYAQRTTRLSANFRFDDGGTSAEDFTASQDWTTGWTNAAMTNGGAVFATVVPPLVSDSDDDGMPDYWEIAYGLVSTDASDASADPDADGLLNLTEFKAGTHPMKADSDLDGLNDGLEDGDADGLINEQEQNTWGTNPGKTDSDDDGVNDGNEVGAGTSALYAGSYAPFVSKSLALNGTAIKVPEPTEFQDDNGTIPQRFQNLVRWTIGASVRPAGTETGSLIKRTTCGLTQFELGLNANVPYARMHTFGGTLRTATAATAIPAGSFSTIYATYDPEFGTLVIKVDDCVVASTQVNGTGVRGPGLTTLGQGVNGFMDDVFIGPALLSDAAAAPEYVMIIDNSGSMGIENRMQDAKDAAKGAVDLMPDGSQMAIIRFDDTTELLQDFTTDREALKAAIDTLQPQGLTDYQKPIQLMIDLLSDRPLRGPRVGIFISDGAPQTEPTESELRQVVELATPINTVGFGSTILSGFTFALERIASVTGGQFFPAPSGDELADILGTIIEQSGQNQFGYYAFDDGGVTAEDFLHPLDQTYALKGVTLSTIAAMTNLTAINRTFANPVEEPADWWVDWFLASTDLDGLTEDADSDGVSNLNEYRLGLNPRRADSNGNGVSDGDEDSDGDSLINRAEDSVYGIRPDRADTDDDGVRDNEEIINNFDAVDPAIPLVSRALTFGPTAGAVTISDRIDGAPSGRFDHSEWTVEVMIQPTNSTPAPGTEYPLVLRRVECNGLVNFELGIRYTGSVWRSYARFNSINDTNRVELLGNVVTTDGCTWTHLAASLGDKLFTLYQDGVSVQARDTTLLPARGVGDVVLGGGGYRGKLAETRIWQVKRSAANINDFRNRNILFDSSASDPGVLRTTGDAGHLREVTKPGSGIDQLQEWTLEGWVKTSDTGGGIFIARRNSVDESSDVTNFNYAISLDDIGRPYGSFTLKYTATTVDSNGVTEVTGYDDVANRIYGPTPINDGMWHHIAYTRDLKTASLYVDGVLVAKQDGNKPPTGVLYDDESNNVDPQEGPLEIGRDLDADSDEIRVWRRVLSREEINEVRQMNLTGDENGLITYFNFDYPLDQFADDRAAARDLNEDVGFYVPGATRVATRDQAPMENFMPLRVYSRTSLSGYFPATDGGVYVNDFMKPTDFRYAGRFSGSAAFTNLTGPNCLPYTGDSDEDGLPDWWEIMNGLNPGDATGDDGPWGDPDGDGLNNRAEYLAGTDPQNPDSRGNGLGDYFASVTNGGAFFGDLYTDGDGMDDAWEAQYPSILSPLLHDAGLDPDGDGWDNYSEFMAKTDPGVFGSRPSPTINATFKYLGSNTTGTIRFDAFDSASMNGPVMASGLASLGVQRYEANAGSAESGQITTTGSLLFKPIIPGSVTLLMFGGGTGSLLMEVRDNGQGSLEGGDPLLGSYVTGIIDYETGAWSINRTGSIRISSLNIQADYFSTGNTSYPANSRLIVNSGNFRQGNAWFFAYIDANENKRFDTGEPASIVNRQPVNIQWNGPIEVEFGFTDDLIGYQRFSWPDTGANSYTVVVDSVSFGINLLIRNVIRRNYFHEGDYLFAGRYGLSNGPGFEATVPGSMSAFSFEDNWPGSVSTPSIISPNGPFGGDIVYARSDLVWSQDINSTYTRLEIRRGTNGPVIYSGTNIPPFRAANGQYTMRLPLMGGDGVFSNGVYYWRVLSGNPARTSAWSSWVAFNLNLQDATLGAYTISGALEYYGKVTNGNFVVQAFTTPSFSDLPEAQVSLGTNWGSFALRGLRANTYYVRAFLDQNGNKRIDPFESRGLVLGDHSRSFNGSPLAMAVPGNRTGTRLIVLDQDIDNDNIADAWEYMWFTNITTTGYAGSYRDSDGDGLDDFLESVLGTNPFLADTDGDGLSDGFEFRNSMNVLGFNGDTDGDGILDSEEMNVRFTSPTSSDSDGDGYGDALELILGANPNLSSSLPATKSLFEITEIRAGSNGHVVYYTLTPGITGLSANVRARVTTWTNPMALPARGVPGVQDRILGPTNWSSGPWGVTNSTPDDPVRFYGIEWQWP